MDPENVLTDNVLNHVWTDEDRKEGLRVQIPCAWYATFFSPEELMTFVKLAIRTSISDLGGKNDEVCYVGWQDKDGYRRGDFD